MTRLTTLFLYFAVLALYLAFWPVSGTQLVHGLQTIPTRTSTPGAPPPTVPPPPTLRPDNDNDNPPPATVTVSSTASPTPSLEPLSLDEVCSEIPTVQTNDLVNVRAGPGVDYEILDQLPYLEMRIIVGRAADTAWWLIQLNNEQQGWITDSAVLVQGNIGGLPVLAAPPLNGSTPTPGVPWNPTPYPLCPELPTATSTLESPSPTARPATPAATPTPPPTKASQSPESAAAAATSLIEPTARPTATATSPPPTATDQSTAASQRSQELPTAAPLATDTPAANSDYFLIGAVVLLFIGIAITIWRRRR